MVSIADSVAVVTGGRQGLGAALVDALLERGATKVYSTGRHHFTDPRPRVSPQVLDVRDDRSVAEFAAVASDATIVVNNAGISLPGPLLSADLADAREMVETNVFGPLRVTRAFATTLATNGGGALVNIASVLSWLAGAGAYGASKAALWSLTNSLRLELTGQGTQVLGVHVSFIDTEMVAGIAVAKTAPAEVARRIADALEADASEVLVDEASKQTKTALGGPVENLVIDRFS
ncbi:SDR family oxidoreductase [Mycobacterium sp. 236(2023)]|uniref:SDR family oxidoreductase n=1 Tax=Mycobacterium sp. 236(2023) TaxID=3038163 RepID=UPI0024152111|nr:SDR family oxidoreductase [Mycobacterium sp. 236(2023)]MDG4666502.1 SDR family oxidoreductase [Mycobacterium sp. 236(2023)]